jgi:large subunit ribosomal protein L4
MARVPGRRGGPKAHGPVLRDFSFSLNRKMRAMGMMIALAAKHREGNLIVFDKLECEVRLMMSLFCSFLRELT